jgi:ATP-dependent DNA helicase PIF1
MKINDDLLGRPPGEADDTADINDVGHKEVTGELMSTINCDTLPLSVLRLNVGAPVMLLRNMDPNNGLCNQLYSL